jgi:hypothetical protein
MPFAPEPRRRLALFAACFSLFPAIARGAPPREPGPFAEPPPSGPIEPAPFAEPPPDEPPREPFEPRDPVDSPPYDPPWVAEDVATHPLVFSIFAPAATNGGRPVKTYFEVDALYGQVGELHGLSVGTFSLVEGPAWGLRLGAIANAQGDRGESGGLWLAGLSNFAGGDVAGLNVAGLFNRSRSFDGFQIAGGANVARRTVQGAQIALGGNFARELGGLQIGGLFNGAGEGAGAQAGAVNVVADGFSGAQLGGLNLSLETFNGVQLGAFNHADEAEDALQIGAINAARENEGGLQLGVVNYARRFVRGGLQFGLINVATRGQGTQVGLVSVSERLAVEPIAWASVGQNLFYSAGLRLRNGAPYSQLFFSYASLPGSDRLGAGVALGARVSPEGPFFVDLDAAYTYFAPPERGAGVEHRALGRLTVGWAVDDHFGVFVGGAGGVQVREREVGPAFEVFAGLHF